MLHLMRQAGKRQFSTSISRKRNMTLFYRRKEPRLVHQVSNGRKREKDDFIYVQLKIF